MQTIRYIVSPQPRTAQWCFRAAGLWHGPFASREEAVQAAIVAAHATPQFGLASHVLVETPSGVLETAWRSSQVAGWQPDRAARPWGDRKDPAPLAS